MHGIDCGSGVGGGNASRELDKWLEGWFYSISDKRQLHTRTGTKGFDRLVEAVRSFVEWAGLIEGGGEGRTVKMDEIKRGNVEEFLAGTFFNLPLSTLLSQPLSHHALQSMIISLEHRRNFRFGSGYNEGIKPLCPSMKRHLGRRYTPLAVYILMGLVEGLMGWVLWSVGFGWIETRVEMQGSELKEGAKAEKTDVRVGAWYHPGFRASGGGMFCWLLDGLFPVKQAVVHGDRLSDNDTDFTISLVRAQKKKPIIFIPGLAGPSLLTHFIFSLASLDRPLFVIRQPHLSLSLTARPAASTRHLVSGVEALLEKYGFAATSKTNGEERGLVIAHSLGSGLAAALNDNTAFPQGKVRYRTILLDPISILLCHPHLARTINLASSSSSSSRSGGGMSRLVRYFTKEKGVERYLARDFSPFDNHLSLKQPSFSTLSESSSSLTCNTKPAEPCATEGQTIGKTTVILSRNDHLIPVEKIVTHCKKNGVYCEVLENIGHGAWLFSLPLMFHILAIIKENIKEMNNELKHESSRTATTEETVQIVHGTDYIPTSIPGPAPITVILSTSKMSRARSRAGTFSDTAKNDAHPCNMGGRTRSRTITSCGGVGMMVGRSKLGDGVGKMDRVENGSAAGMGRGMRRNHSVRDGMGVWT
nr:uncharacterized protein CI109_001591 [Kwoniella shandongensis]KAA5530185.1 hypothetical protein CI109_001591 [Kwoniella shandongensis]